MNGECVRQAVRTGMALGAQINRWSRFDRKNYFYADLPQGYQISQLYHPIVGEGTLTVEPEGEAPKTIGIERIHLEQDAGKSVHDQSPGESYVDLNRSGVALMEIVSKPDMRSPAQAGAYVRSLREVLRYVGSCDGNMDEGSMRADVNVSVRKPGAEFGTRTETKNVNSVRFVMADDRARGTPPDRRAGGRRHHRPGNPPVRPGQGRHPLDAVEGGRARLSLLPRSRPAAGRARRRVHGRLRREPARAAVRQARALSKRSWALVHTMPLC